jgi:hypothetical protein
MWTVTRACASSSPPGAVRTVTVPFTPVAYVTTGTEPTPTVPQGGRSSSLRAWAPDGILLATEADLQYTVDIVDLAANTVRVALRLSGAQLVSVRGS